jgi:RNA polymerase sigma-B factor
VAGMTPGAGDSQNQRLRNERALFVRRETDDAACNRELLVERFMPLARSLALRYRRSGEPLDDLLQVASMGLIKAIDRFDADRGIPFASYAVPTILGEIKRYFRDHTWAVNVPNALQELSLRVDRAVDELAEELHRQPLVAEIAAAVDSTEEDVMEALQARGAYRARSFDAPVDSADEASGTLGDWIGIDEYGFDRAEARATFAALLKLVTARESEVLRMRFEQDMTQTEISVIIGTSQMHVSRIIRQALERIRLATGRRSALD